MEMNNSEVKTWHILVFMGLMGWMIYMIYDKPTIVYDNVKTNCKEDSLQLVINELQHTLETEEDGWDSKEKRYEDVIFEYEYGLNHLKEYQPNAYKEFHRIIGFKERFSVESERENKKRLNDFN
jgi:hypothetical protein